MSLQPDRKEIQPKGPGSTAVPADGAVKNYPTTFAHRFVTVIGFAFLAFEVGFLFLYAGDFWFSQDIFGWGIPAVCLTMVLCHFLLTFAESPYAISRLSFIWKGRPPIVYRKWLSVSPEDFAFGLRHVLFAAVDELELSFMGNLIVKSWAVCGKLAPSADIVVKIPYSPVSLETANKFLQTVRTMQPQVLLNKRLTEQGFIAKIKGAQWVRLLGPVFLFLVLLDVGDTSFDYLQVIKGYYRAQTQALAGQLGEARASFARAEKESLVKLPVSYVRPKFFEHGVIAAGLFQARSQALWDMGDKQEALNSAVKAVSCQPTSIRQDLYCARLLAAMGKESQSRSYINRALDAHEDSFLPRLYMLASFLDAGSKDKARQFAQISIDDLNEQVYVGEPMWPPGGDHFLNDLFYVDDIKFLLGRLASQAPERKAGTSVKND
jgi:tetratricopeptide (TPR) repeat protein